MTKNEIQDEYIAHIRIIERLMKKHNRIGVFGLPGEGKSHLIMALREKYQDTIWNFYELGENPVTDPFVFAFISDQQIVPDFDIIFCMQYSKRYKEAVSGVKFDDGEWHPIKDYMKRAERQRMDKINITGKTVKNMKELSKLLNGEV